MKFNLLLALLFVFVFSFTGIAGAYDSANPHGLGQEQRELKVHFDAPIPEVARPYLDKMSVMDLNEVRAGDSVFFSVLSVMPDGDPSGVISATSLYCHSTEQGPTSIDVYLNRVARVYIFRANPNDPNKPKIERIYVDEQVPCIKETKK
jgi:hypothetical protein